MTFQHVFAAALLTLCLAGGVQAQGSQDKAARLGGDTYNCLGGKIAGSDDGVARYTGKWFKKWPGVDKDQGYAPSPYDDEQPLFTITADNMAKYADKLTAGEKALLKKYPDEYRMNVYPSHRDFRMPEYVCHDARKNAASAKLLKNGLAVKGAGGAPPFPVPDNGLQAIWNVINAVSGWDEEATYDIADIYSNGDTTWGRVHFKQMNPTNNPDPDERADYSSKVRSYFLQAYQLPARNKGEVSVGFQANDFSQSNTQAWQYQPGIRRVRKAPEIGFDYPIPPAGLRTVDSDYVFNGSPERFNWKLMGKKEVYVPYNNFKVNDPALTYDELLGKHTLNPKYVRYELHRVWVIEGTLKKGMRHIFQRRVIYVDEDTWLATTADNYDQQGQIYRVPMIMYHYSQAGGTYHRGVSVYHTLTSGAYEATYLLNERDADQWWRINIPMRKQGFSPSAAMREGQ